MFYIHQFGLFHCHKEIRVELVVCITKVAEPESELEWWSRSLANFAGAGAGVGVFIAGSGSKTGGRSL